MSTHFVAAGDARWFRFLSRWALLAGLLGVGILLVFGLVVIPASQTTALPPGYTGIEYMEFPLAVQSPLRYHLFVSFDILGWLAEGVFLITLAAIVAPRAPIRSTFIAACGIGQIVGFAGAATRIGGVTALAAHYATATPDQRVPLLNSYRDLMLVATSHFGAGALLWGIGVVLAASVAWSLLGFPRWLTIGLAVQGSIMLTQQIVQILTGMDLGFVFFPAFVLEILIYFAIAARFWRRAPAYVPELRVAPASGEAGS